MLDPSKGLTHAVEETERKLLELELRDALLAMTRAADTIAIGVASARFVIALNKVHSYGAHVLVFRGTEGELRVHILEG